MFAKLSAPILRSPAAVAAGLFWLLTATAGADEITGEVTVLSKEGQALTRFDHAVVYVEGTEAPPPAEPAVMDQKNKEFVPRLLPVVKGQEIRFLNSDKVQHNVFSPHEQEPFDLGLYPAGESKSVRLTHLRRHNVYCNLHKNMVADILVLPSPYFSLTDEKGRYLIRGLPPGDYVLRVWHIFGGTDQKPIRVEKTPLKADFTIRSTQSNQDVIEHPNKAGQSYPAATSESY
jgi:plastocyanin